MEQNSPTVERTRFYHLVLREHLAKHRTLGYHNRMSRQRIMAGSGGMGGYADVMALKDRMREQDRRDLLSGRKSPRQIQLKNDIFGLRRRGVKILSIS